MKIKSHILLENKTYLKCGCIDNINISTNVWYVRFKTIKDLYLQLSLNNYKWLWTYINTPDAFDNVIKQ